MPVKQDSRPELSVIMPAYNEGAHIHANIQRVCETLDGLHYEIIVVDDGSSDTTFAESQRAADEGYPVRAVRQEVNRGKGASLFHGFEFASGKLVAFLDSDLEIAPENLLSLIKVMREANADVVAGVKDLQANQFPPMRRLMSRGYRTMVAFLFGLTITDTQTGIKLFRREVLTDAIPRVSARRFAFDIELLVAASRFGYRIVEQPVEISYRRSGGLGRVNLAQLFNMTADTLAIFYRASFWHWLNPGLLAQTWMILFVLGIFLSGVGFAKLLTPTIPQGAAKQFFYIVLLQFIPSPLRDWLILAIGIIFVIISLIQLNKIVMTAFGKRDRDDLSGIRRK
ncbi:MAG: glycosyltransferase family 2 protein [Anaerolineaceae bacterium]|nr:MAG: glycosyltransferase family 2 protein [Anaerolineaceae bacterium]